MESPNILRSMTLWPGHSHKALHRNICCPGVDVCPDGGTGRKLVQESSSGEHECPQQVSQVSGLVLVLPHVLVKRTFWAFSGDPWWKSAEQATDSLGITLWGAWMTIRKSIKIWFSYCTFSRWKCLKLEENVTTCKRSRLRNQVIDKYKASVWNILWRHRELRQMQTLDFLDGFKSGRYILTCRTVSCDTQKGIGLFVVHNQTYRFDFHHVKVCKICNSLLQVGLCQNCAAVATAQEATGLM